MPRRRKSQKQMILEMLESGAKVTPMSALNSCGVFRLAAVILDLRQMGHNIQTNNVKSHTGNSYAEYTLA